MIKKSFKVLSCLFLLIGSSCSTPMPATAPTPTPTNSGIEGHVFIGPICPVVQVGQECPDQPYQAQLTVTTSSGERIVQIQTDENGYFKIPLPPGDYILHPESPNTLPFAGEQAVRVETDTFTQVVINYDSGIR